VNVILFIIGIIFGSIGGILMKIGAGHIGTTHITNLHDGLVFFTKIFTNITVLGGIVLYFISTLIWIFLLTKLPISFVQPILALTYVLTPVLAIVFLNEHIPVMRWFGIMVIVVGVFVVARTSTGS